MPLPLSIFVITKNEARRIGRTLQAVRHLTDDLIVVDSGSTDGTQTIAASLGATVIQHDWDGYGRQKRFAEEQCRHDWLFNLDADEVATGALCEEIRQLFQHPREPEACAYSVHIKDVIPGEDKPRRLAYAHKYVRLYHKDAGSFATSSVHDVVHVNPGFKVKPLRGAIYHYSVLDLSSQISKYNSYTDALVQDLKDRDATKGLWRCLPGFRPHFSRRISCGVISCAAVTVTSPR